MNEDMAAYGFTDKLRHARSSLDCIVSAQKYFIPGSPGLNWLRVFPAAEFSGSDPKYLTGFFLGNALRDSIVYGSSRGVPGWLLPARLKHCIPDTC